MKKLKICLISFKIPPDSQDGTAKFFRGIYDYLQGQGHNVKLLTGKWNYQLDDPDIIQIPIIKKRFLWFPFFCLGVIRYLRSHYFDIIHGNGPKGSLPIILANKRHFIATIHDLGFFTRIPIERILLKMVAKKPTYITTCSETIKMDLKKFMPELNLNNIFNLYSAIEEKFRPYPKQAAKLKRKLGIKSPIIIYIGRITHYKGVDDIIKAYYLAKQQIKDLTLVIGGKPDFRTQNKYDEWKQKYEDIEFVGFLPKDEIPYYYSMADIFITYSYTFEGFGLTPIEAIACGTPVICSSLPVFKEVLQNNAIFVPPRSPSQLADAIVRLLQNEEKREKLITNAQNFINRYSWKSVGRKLEKVYTRFIKNKRSNKV
jgi:glycosyltransferase involved in cell wall biosynthesis